MLVFGEHRVERVIETTQRAMVLRARVRDRACALRVLLTPVPLRFDALVREACLRGAPLPGELAELEGYRARAALGAIDGLPTIVAAGISDVVPRLIEAPRRGMGYAYVSVEWIEGRAVEARDLGALSELVAALHARGVAHGAVDRAVVDGDAVWLPELSEMREGGDVERDRRSLAAVERALGAERTIVEAPVSTIFVPDSEPGATVFVSDERPVPVLEPVKGRGPWIAVAVGLGIVALGCLALALIAAIARGCR